MILLAIMLNFFLRKYEPISHLSENDSNLNFFFLSILLMDIININNLHYITLMHLTPKNIYPLKDKCFTVSHIFVRKYKSCANTVLPVSENVL